MAFWCGEDLIVKWTPGHNRSKEAREGSKEDGSCGPMISGGVRYDG